MASNGERRMNEQLRDPPRLGLERSDGEEEEEIAEGGVSVLAARCGGLSLVGGVEGGGFSLPGLGGGGGGRLGTDRPARSSDGGTAGARRGLWRWFGGAACGGGVLVWLEEVAAWGCGDLVRPEEVVAYGDGDLEGIVGVAYGGGGLNACNSPNLIFGNTNPMELVLVKPKIMDGGTLMACMWRVMKFVWIVWLKWREKLIWLDAKLVDNDGGGGGYLGVNSVWKLLVLLLVVDEGYNSFVCPHE